MYTPVVRPISWLRFLALFPICFGIVILFYLLGPFKEAFVNIILALAICFAFKLLIKNLLTSHYIKGMRYVKRQMYKEAVQEFEKNLEYWESHLTLNSIYWLISLHPSLFLPVELSLHNLGFCYGQLGEKNKSKEYYSRVLELNPQNGMAIVAMRLIETGEK